MLVDDGVLLDLARLALVHTECPTMWEVKAHYGRRGSICWCLLVLMLENGRLARTKLVGAAQLKPNAQYAATVLAAWNALRTFHQKS